MNEQYMAADEIWAMMPELHAARAKGNSFTSEGERVRVLTELSAVVLRLSKEEEPHPMTEEETKLLALLDEIGSNDMPREGEFDITEEQAQRLEQLAGKYDDDEVDAIRAKKEEIEERKERYVEEAPPLSEESVEKLTMMAKEIDTAAKKLKKMNDIREGIIMAAYEAHYFDVEDVLEEVGIACLTMLAMSTPGKTEPWYEGREGAREVLGACQRMSLKNMRLKNRIDERPTAQNDAAPTPPPWYLATQGEYFTGHWRKADLLQQPIPTFQWDDSSPTGYAQ